MRSTRIPEHTLESYTFRRENSFLPLDNQDIGVASRRR
jgi:hypothetical protein